MRPPINYISLQESKLYGVKRKRDLAKILGVTVKKLKSLTSDKNYREWTNAEGRIIEQPSEELAMVLSKLHNILSEIQTPDYLLSGKKRIKPRQNADLHATNNFMINVDIAKFYQSTKKKYIFSAFKSIFDLSPDVSDLLANLVTYKGHIPTGTATSQAIAYWAYKKTFDRIHMLSLCQGILMSVWVDDIVFSSKTPLPKGWVKEISKIFYEVELSLKLQKTKKYNSKDFKTVTGTAISPKGELFVKNQKRKEIIDILRKKTVEDLNLKQSRSLFGKLTAQRQIQADFFEDVYKKTKKHLKSLEKNKT